MAVGVPFVMSPVGVGAEIGEPGKTHFNADTCEEWEAALEKLLASAALRTKMGQNGRKFGVENYAVSGQADKLENLFREVTRK